MPNQITPHIQQLYDDAEVQQVIDENASLTQQFSDPDVKNNRVCVVLPVVRRYAGYQQHQFDLDLFIKHNEVTELGQLEMYRVSLDRVKDFIRQKVDIAPVLYTVQQVTGVNIQTTAENIKRQVKNLQKPENRDLPMASAQMINSGL